MFRNCRWRCTISRRAFIVGAAAGAALSPRYVGAATLDPEEAKQIAIDAYIYGYSLITTDVTRVDMSNVATVEELRAPTGTFFNVKGYPPATYRGVSATNADTLYSVAWLELADPQVFSHPEIKDRILPPSNWSICG